MTYSIQDGVVRGDALTYEPSRRRPFDGATPARLDLREVTGLYLLEAQECRAARRVLHTVAPPTLRDPPIKNFDEMQERFRDRW